MKSIMRRGISILLSVSLYLCAVGVPVSAENEVETEQTYLETATEEVETEQGFPADSEDCVLEDPECGENNPLTMVENGKPCGIEDSEPLAENDNAAEQSVPDMEEETVLPELDGQTMELSPLEQKAGIRGVPANNLLAAPAFDTSATILMPSYTGGTLTAGTYYLTSDITLSSRITVSSGTVNLYLNGYVMKGSGSSSVIYVSGSSTVLNIYDSYADVDPSVLYNAMPYHSFTVSSYLYTVGASQLTASGSTITGGVITNGSNTYGGGIYLASGTVNLYAGTIAGNRATSTSTSYGGGGVYVGGSFQMHGGAIVGNMAAKYGGGVLIRSGAFSMSGNASITGNRAATSSGYGGGVYYYDGTFRVSGSPVISGNVRYNSTACNVYLYNTSRIITVEGALQEGASIGVFTTSARTFTSGYAEANAGVAVSQYFSSDSASYKVGTHLNEGYLLSSSANSFTLRWYRSGSVVKTQTVPYGQSVTLRFPDATLDGWILYGWAESNSTTALTARFDGESVSICANVSLYAVFQRDVTFVSGLNGSTSRIVTQYYYGSSARAMTAPGITAPSSGWTAYGWYSGTEAVNAREVSAGASFTPSASVYYAISYRSVGKLEYDANGGSGTMEADDLLQYYNSSGTICGEASCTIPMLCGFSPPGNESFVTWNTAPGGTGTEHPRNTEYSVPVAYAVTESVSPAPIFTLYAQWGVPRGLYQKVDGGDDLFITDISGVILETGTYYLTGNLLAYEPLSNGFLVVPAGAEVDFYLDGYTIDLNGIPTGIYLSGGTLNLYDTYLNSGRSGGKITNVGVDSYVLSGAVELSSGTLNMYGGSFCENHDVAIGVLSSGTLNMYGGSIDHNDGNSGAVSVSGTFNLYDGTISNNITYTGAVSINSGDSAPYPTFNMYGGLVTENVGLGSYQGGAGVALFTMFGQGYFNMSGGEISNNIAFNRGGGVSTYGGPSYSNITLTGGRIVNNAAPKAGSVNAYSDSTRGGGGISLFGQIYLSGNPVIENNYVYDEMIDNGDGTYTLRGPTLNNLESLSDETRLIHVNGAFTENASIGIYTDTAERYYGGDYGYGDGGYNAGIYPTAYFHSDNLDYAVSLNGTTDGIYLLPARTIAYDRNDADSGTAPQSASIAVGDTYVISSNTGNLARNGRVFDGWNSASDGSGEHYQVGDTITVSESLTLYAMFANVFSVTVPATLPVTVNADGTLNVTANAAIVNNSSGDVIISDVSITPAEGWTLDASFDPLRAPVDSRRFSFAVTTASGEALTSQAISAQQNLPLRYTAAFAARSTPIDDTEIARVVFTVRWANEENTA